MGYNEFFKMVAETSFNTKNEFLEKQKNSTFTKKEIELIYEYGRYNDIRLTLISLHMTIKEASKYLMIPYRTLQNWIEGVRKAPQYTIDMIAYTLITSLYEIQK